MPTSSNDADDGFDSLAELRMKVRFLFLLDLPEDGAVPAEESDLLELVTAIQGARALLKPILAKHDEKTTWRDTTTEATVVGSKDRTAAEVRADNVAVVVDDVSIQKIYERIRAWEFLLLRPFLTIALIMVAWVFGGALVFLYNLRPFCAPVGGVVVCKDVNYAMAVYYSTQAGFSVGFGLLTERPNGARWYTIFHGLVGLTIIAAGLTLFLLRPGGRLASRIAGDPERVWAETNKDEDAVRFMRRIFRKVKRIVLMELPLLMLLILLATCIIFNCISNDWSFTTACYFAFFALSTGGLQAPGSVSDAQMIFSSFYLMVGIPLFGATMSRLVDVVLDK